MAGRPKQRYCPKGHDKYTVGGAYIIRMHGYFAMSCAICNKASVKKYRENLKIR